MFLTRLSALLVLLLIAGGVALDAPPATAKAGLTARTFVSLVTEVQEVYVAGITDALDDAGLLHCPPGTSYRQVISLAEAYIYKNKARADTMWAATAVIEALKESGCGKPRAKAKPKT